MRGAIVVCDGAQAAPHLPLDIDSLDVDFYAFSGHKMLGPMGCGVLVGRRALLEAMPPYQSGGDMIEYVGDERSTWNVLPHKFEAGTPNVADAVGLAAACEYLDALGMPAVRGARAADHRRWRTERLVGDSGRSDLRPAAGAARAAWCSFTVGDIHPHDLATILDEVGVCVRAGHHCAQPLMRRSERAGDGARVVLRLQHREPTSMRWLRAWSTRARSSRRKAVGTDPGYFVSRLRKS